MRHVLVHAHIFKNAGTTFDFSLARNFADGFIDHREDDKFLAGRNGYLLEYLGTNHSVKALSSHSLHFRIAGNEEMSLHPVYFLRHPLARVWSVYNFEQQQAGVDTEGARRAKELDLNRYVDWYMQEGSPATIRNIHTIFLSGEGPSPDSMAHKFALASDYLGQARASFPVVERYVDSMLVLEQQLENYFPGIDLSFVRKNVSETDPGRSTGDRVNALLDALDADVALKLQERNEYDLVLYQRANALLDAQLAQVTDLEDKRAAFMERCKQEARNKKQETRD